MLTVHWILLPVFDRMKLAEESLKIKQIKKDH